MDRGRSPISWTVAEETLRRSKTQVREPQTAEDDGYGLRMVRESGNK